MANLSDLTYTPFYAELSCQCHTIDFFVIISHLGPLHLCFTHEKHQKALREIKTLLPGIEKIDVGGPAMVRAAASRSDDRGLR